MRENPHSSIGLKDIFRIFGKAFIKAGSMETAVNGFKKTGIYPLNRDIFKDEEFAFVRSSVPETFHDAGIYILS